MLQREYKSQCFKNLFYCQLAFTHVLIVGNNGGTMKTLLLTLAILSTNVMAESIKVTQDNVAALYEQADVPDFTPWIGVALPGRCFFKSPMERQVSSVLLTFQKEEGLAIAPLAADKRAENFFDNLSFETITRRFPQYKRLTRPVYYSMAEAVLLKQEGSLFYEGRIKEFQDYFFVKVILKENAVRFCYYNKV